MKVLFRYTGIPLNPEFEHFAGHSGKWCWWAIGNAILNLGHDMIPLDWNKPFIGQETFDGIFSIQHLHGLKNAYDENTTKIIRLTMSDPYYHNEMVKKRTASINKRKGSNFAPARLLDDFPDYYDDYALADAIFLNGNDYVRRTYPEKYWSKIIPMNTCAANIKYVEPVTSLPDRKEFLYHAGGGAVHKGLDLVIDAFVRHPEWRLHITSNLKPETGFLAAYQKELNLPNITYYGWMVVQDVFFQQLLKRVYAFILPTCSEGQSPAVATCLTLGLYPIISRYTGIDLPENCGIYIDDLTVDDVEEAVLKLIAMKDAEVLRQIKVCQSDALVKYSRETFVETVTGYLKEYLK